MTGNVPKAREAVEKSIVRLLFVPVIAENTVDQYNDIKTACIIELHLLPILCNG